MINHELKCIFVHIIKTGGVSIATGLNMQAKQCHLTASEIRTKVGDATWNRYFKFSIIRNPWDKMVSSYHFNHHKWVPEGTPFEDYIRRWGKGQQITRFPPQNSAYINEDLDFIGHFETLEADFQTILSHLKHPPLELGHLNRSRHRNYRDYYSDETRQIVENQFTDDIRRWGFRF